MAQKASTNMNSRADSSTARSPTDKSATASQGKCCQPLKPFPHYLWVNDCRATAPVPEPTILQSEGLRHVIVSATLQSGDFIPHVVTSGENNDRQLFALASQFLQRRPTIFARETYIKD
jgi:hypothetical protein